MPHEQRMRLADDAFTQHRGRHGDPEPSSANFINFSCKPKRWISTHARITGRLAAAMRRTDSVTASESASGDRWLAG